MCPDCRHAAHASRCWAWVGRVEQCACKRRDDDGRTDDDHAQPSPSAADAVAVDASTKGLKALLGGALERDSGLAMDLAHDESDGGLGVVELP